MNNKLNPVFLIFLLVSAMAIPSLGRPGKDLNALRELALGLLKQKDLGASSAYCELITSRHTNRCAGSEKQETRLTIRKSGTLELVRFRSWAESPEPRPGLYRGKLSPENWKGLLVTLSKMDWEKNPFPMPMPGMSETYTELTLSDGKKTAMYSIVGSGPRGQQRISAGFRKAFMIGQEAKDTVWSLALVPVKAEIKKGMLQVQAKWEIAGNSAASISLAGSQDDSSCGKTSLAWYFDKPETPGVTPLPVEFHYVGASSAKVSGTGIDPKNPISLQLRFPFSSQFAKGAMGGKIIQTGVQVLTPGSETPVMATVFSESIPF